MHPVHVTLRPVTRANLREICMLQVAKSQTDFVAPNVVSMAEAYVTVTGGGVALPYGIYDGNMPVGFVLLGYGALDEEDEPPIAAGNYCLWRLMIDAAHQRKGYGAAAMRAVLAWLRTRPTGPATHCWLSYDPENAIAQQLYASFGFEETGEVCGGELVAVLPL